MYNYFGPNGLSQKMGEESNVIKKGDLVCPQCNETFVKMTADLREGELILHANFENVDGTPVTDWALIKCGSSGCDVGFGIVLGHNDKLQND